MRKHYDFSFLMLYCDNSGLLDATELSNGNRQGNSPNNVPYSKCWHILGSIGMLLPVEEPTCQISICTATALVSIGRQSSEMDIMGSSHYQQPA